VAHREETAVVVPVVVEPVEVELALRVVPVEISHVALVVDNRNGLCMKYRLPHHPLNTLGVEFCYERPCMSHNISHQLF